VVTVPVAVQNNIVSHAPQLAFAPSQLPAGYHYLSWNWSQYEGRVRIIFGNGAGKKIVFVSTWDYGKCRGGQEQTYSLDGSVVFYGHRGRDEDAWRCVRQIADTSNVVVEISADTTATSLPVSRLTKVVSTAKLLHYRSG
jgi:hypothetical protein